MITQTKCPLLERSSLLFSPHIHIHIQYDKSNGFLTTQQFDDHRHSCIAQTNKQASRLHPSETTVGPECRGREYTHPPSHPLEVHPCVYTSTLLLLLLLQSRLVLLLCLLASSFVVLLLFASAISTTSSSSRLAIVIIIGSIFSASLYCLRLCHLRR